MDYVIDGYNVLKQIPEYSEKILRNGRDGLIKFIEERRPQGSLKNRVIVVFDGGGNSEDVYPSVINREKNNMQIRFSLGESADDCIRHIVKTARHPGDTCVVTNDRGLRQSVKPCGAKLMTVREFVEKASRSQQPDMNRHGRKPGIKEQLEITEEMSKIWR